MANNNVDYLGLMTFTLLRNIVASPAAINDLRISEVAFEHPFGVVKSCIQTCPDTGVQVMATTTSPDFGGLRVEAQLWTGGKVKK